MSVVVALEQRTRRPKQLTETGDPPVESTLH